ncbi:MAG: CidA/LrgA family protein [Fusobacterium gastrosuis]|uniref:CidA/LrgA family protein n=1 Tax=Fusobacterium TaxID=848 RepID=UPI001F4FA3B2|nr:MULTISPECIES: CidA/LrgA family protein [Fusobacterium]MDD7409604.1 CidA/LrgA family protein [Fusobacteriaceae bacterium]MCI7222694.1 CidA/LrgA family protein [Fusobacterium sp.]MDY4010644.1 CidA/LrgA family protein [Fusobacterium gastrosuis]MDY5305705.1 CidA/LrgA family protein [Fusobacterium gastrosuis]MDY5713319.1 CidA/LrgA family protein [Fusobacterium gastrosuis]
MLNEFIILFIINYIGIIISKVFKLPVPGTIIGMVLFFILLYTKVLKVEKVENAVAVLILNMTILFMPPAVRILDNIHFLDGQFIKVIILIILTTLITMGTTGKIVQFMIELTEKRKSDKGDEN